LKTEVKNKTVPAPKPAVKKDSKPVESKEIVKQPIKSSFPEY